MDTERRFRLATDHNAASVKLARWVALASRIEPALLRRARLLFLPGASVAAEGDLWFSPLVHTRAPREILFHPGVAERLRRELVEQCSAEEVCRARELVKAMHRHLPGLIQCEEELLWLSLQPGAAGEAALRGALAPMIKAVATQHGRNGLARWALGILPFMPTAVRTHGGLLLEVLAEQQLFPGRVGTSLIAGGELSSEERALAARVAASKTESVLVGVRLFGDTLELTEPPAYGAETVRVPATRPRVIELTWGRGIARRTEPLAWPPGHPAHISKITTPLTFTTLAGERCRLRSARAAHAALDRKASSFLVHLIDSERRVLGVGWVVAPGRVLISGAAWEQAQAGEWSIIFPLLPKAHVYTGGRAERPTSPSSLSEEPVLLRLNRLSIEHSAPLGKWPPSTSNEVRVLARNRITGDWQRFVVEQRTYFQLVPVPASQNLPKETFVGSPLLEEATGRVIGMVSGTMGKPVSMIDNKELFRLFPILNAPRRVFILCAKEDGETFHAIQAGFRSLVPSVSVEGMNASAEEWQRELAQFDSSIGCVVLVLLSPELLTSTTARPQIAAITELSHQQNLIVTWVVARPCSWQEVELVRFQAIIEPSQSLAGLDKKGRSAAFRKIARKLHSLARMLTATDDTEHDTGDAAGAARAEQVFISYGRDNHAIAEEMRQHLHAESIEAWVDKAELRAGDHIEETTRQAIERCGVFLALVDRHTEERMQAEAFFLREWGMALERMKQSTPPRPWFFWLILENQAPSEYPHILAYLESHLPGMPVWRSLWAPSGNLSPEVLKEIRDALERSRFRRAFVCSGHLIDMPWRMEPRFPPEKEPAVRAAIDEWLELSQAGFGDLAVCGAALGADILFAESCLRRGMHVRLLIALEEQEYLKSSVSLPDDLSWQERYHQLKLRCEIWFQNERLGPPPQELDAFARCNLWMVHTALAEVAREAVHAVLVWDEQPSTENRPGGTSHFAQEIQRVGIEPHIINPMKPNPTTHGPTNRQPPT